MAVTSWCVPPYVNATACDLREPMSTGVNATDGEVKEYLRQLSWEKMADLWPSVAFVLLLILLGVPGNTLVFLVFWRYFKASSTRVFVLSMAVCDLLTSVLSSPFYVLQTRFLYDLANPYLCPTTFVIHRLPVIMSGWLLVAVALDRRHRVCRPLSRQLNSGQASCLVLTSLILACGATLPFISLHGKIAVTTTRAGVCGQRCGVTHGRTVSAHSTAEWWALTLSLTIGLLLLVSSYLCIGHHLHRRRSRTQSVESQELSSKLTASVKEAVTAENSITGSVSNYDKQRDNRSKSFGHLVGKKISPRTTLMMFVLTVTAITAYLPFVVLSFVSDDDVYTYCLEKDGRATRIWCVIALYFVNVNSVLNPFIYSSCNPVFRRKCRQFFIASRR